MKSKMCLGFFMLFSMAICYGGKIEPVKKDGVVELFNAERHANKKIYRRSAPWVKGDLKPVLSDEENADGKWIKFSYTGTKGLTQANFSLPPNMLQSLLPEDNVYSGIKIGIYYAGKDLFKIGMSLSFTDNTILRGNLVLKEGYHEYFVKSGFRRAKFPPKWDLLSTVDFIKRSKKEIKATFLLKKIVMATKEVKLQKKAEDKQ